MLKVLVVGCVALLGGCVAYVPVYAPPVEVAGATCYAGFYVCPAVPGPPGAPCSCPGIGAPSYGTTR